jgi:CRP-like cAMP-binding protein
MLHLNQFLSEGRFEPALKQKLREFFKWRHSLQDASTNSSLLERMSPSLRGASIKALDMWIDNVKILSHCPRDFVTQAIMRMERAHYPPGEVIVQAGSYDNAMYIVKQGLVVLGSATGGCILKTGWGCTS